MPDSMPPSLPPQPGTVPLTEAPNPSPDTPSTTAPHHETGRPPRREGFPTIPGYEFLEELGRGGMGVVYKARDLRLDRLVAVKMVLAGGYAGEETLQRFLNEAQVAAGL